MVESGGLENRCTRKGTVGSNPTLSANGESGDGTEWGVLLSSLTPVSRTHDSRERCRSGLTGSTGNAVYGKPYRGFESHPLRQVKTDVE